MRHQLCLLFFLLVTFSVDAQTRSDKNPIDTAEVNYIEINKVGNNLEIQIKKLNKRQGEIFIQKWNEAVALGADKYKFRYVVYVYLNNGQKRKFMISGSKIQESGWLTYDMKNKNYMDALWKSIQ